MSKEFETFKAGLEWGYIYREYFELEDINISDEYDDYVNERDKDLVNMDINFDDDLLFQCAMSAHDQDITLNEYILNVLKKTIGEQVE